MQILHWLTLITGAAGLATGLYILALGDWKKLALKYAAVSLSTCAAALALYLSLVDRSLWSCNAEIACELRVMINIARNISFICFHIAAGRDAMTFKHFDRRRKINETKRNAA